MSRFIEEFYYGNIDPQARGYRKGSHNLKVSQNINELEEKLTERLSDLLTNALHKEQKKWFLDYVNAWGVVNGESNLDSFIMGFRLRANFAYEAFVSTETPFQDLLKE